MPVIGEDTVGDEADRVPLEALAEDLQKRAIILRTHQQRGFSDTAVDDVNKRSGVQLQAS